MMQQSQARQRWRSCLYAACCLLLVASCVEGASFSDDRYVYSNHFPADRSVSVAPLAQEVETGATSIEVKADNPCEVAVGQANTRRSAGGMGATAVAVFMVMAFCAAITVWNYRLNEWNKVEYDRLPAAKTWTFKRSASDYFKQFTLATDAIQVLTLVVTGNYAFNFWGVGLTFQKIHTSYPSDAAHLFRAILKISIFDFDEFGFWTKPADYNNSLWGIIPFCLVMSFLFLLLVIGIYREWDKDFLKTPTGRVMVHSFIFLGPFFGHVMFIPIVYNLLSTFSCNIQKQPVTDPSAEYFGFVARDCTVTCWKGKHNSYLVVSAIGLAMYLPAAFWTAPVWQMLPDSLTIKDQPRYVMTRLWWKLALCMAGAFLPQFPIGHSIAMLWLVACEFGLTMKWRPTTLPYYDLIVLTVNAELLWCAISVVTGLFLFGWVTLTILGIGCSLIFIEFFFLMNTTEDDTGKWAKGSIPWKNRQRQLQIEAQLKKAEKHRRLREVALHNRKLLMATNKREVDPLGDTDRSGDIRIDMHGGGGDGAAHAVDVLALAEHSESTRQSQSKGKDGVEDVKFVDRFTGKTVTVKPILNKSKKVPNVTPKVMGLKLDTSIPSQFPMSFKLRPDQSGTLLIMRSQDHTLKRYLDLKMNAYHAYHTAYQQTAPPAVEESEKEKERQMVLLNKGGAVQRANTFGLSSILSLGRKNKKKAKKTRDAVYLVAMKGPTHDIWPVKEEKVDTPIEPYTRVNNSSLMAILQNTGSDQRAFQGNIAHHAKSMREYTAANSSTQRTLGRAAAEALGLKLHKPVREVKKFDQRTVALQAKLAELKDMEQNMDREFAEQMQAFMHRRYMEGQAEGRKQARLSQ